MTYDHYRDDSAGLPAIIIRIPRGPHIGTDILTDGKWVPIDPAKFGGAPNPWGGKIGRGDVEWIEDPLG